MPEDVRLWEVVSGDHLTELPKTKLNLERRIEDWITQDISILAADLLVIGRQVATDFGGYVDLLCIDSEGNLTVVELKRDKTPREVTAQALDYAAWVETLSPLRVSEIAAQFLNAGLEETFEKRFNKELPDSLNEQQSILVVGSEIDAGSERIIRYLSESYGVDINAITFSYFRTSDGRELLARVFLVDPAEVTQNKNKSRGVRSILSEQQLQDIANEQGVGELYASLRSRLSGLLGRPTTNKSAAAFLCRSEDGSQKVTFSLVPGKSDSANGVSFQAYTHRISEYLHRPEQSIVELLPKSRKVYEYYQNAPKELTGWSGFFKNQQEIDCFVEGLKTQPLQAP